MLYIVIFRNVDAEKQQSTDDLKGNQLNEDDDKCYPYSMLYNYQQFERDIVGNSKMQMIVKYVGNVLNMLGVKYGCAHCEVMYLPKENRVCLVELNARMHGGLPRAAELVKYDQMSLLALSQCNHKRFLSETPKYYVLDDGDDDNKDAENKKGDLVTIRAIFLRSRVDGKMNMTKLIQLKTLKTFKSFARTLYDGVRYWKQYKAEAAVYAEGLEKMEQMKDDEIDMNEMQECIEQLQKTKSVIERIEKVEKTIDLITCPGTIVLQGKLGDIETDYATIRAMENDFENGLFIPRKKDRDVKDEQDQNKI